MRPLEQQLRSPQWGLSVARELAAQTSASKSQAMLLIRQLFTEDTEVRKRAADVTRRMTDADPRYLRPYFFELAGLLAALPPSEHRTRWHLGLVVPRIAHTDDQKTRAAELMLLLAADESNVVRCSAVEGLGVLALQDESFRGEAEAMVHQYLRTGTAAMKCRARHVEKLFAKASSKAKF